jgi:hypothetical protein
MRSGAAATRTAVPQRRRSRPYDYHGTHPLSLRGRPAEAQAKAAAPSEAKGTGDKQAERAVGHRPGTPAAFQRRPVAAYPDLKVGSHSIRTNLSRRNGR